VKGVYAVGDCAMPVKRVTIVVASGTARAGGLSGGVTCGCGGRFRMIFIRKSFGGGVQSKNFERY
jgi:hypothetical protein